MAANAQPFCPCGNQLTYQNCCEKFHLGLSKPQTAEELMRSRYSAFSKKVIPYLIQTLHPEKLTPQTFVDLTESCKECDWLKLKIIKKSGGLKEDKIGTVSFVADYKIGHEKFRMSETSLFIKIKDEWFYKEAVSLNFT